MSYVYVNQRKCKLFKWWVSHSLFLHTFGSLEAVKLDWLDVDDQVGHFFCGKCLAACCTLYIETHTSKYLNVMQHYVLTKGLL